MTPKQASARCGKLDDLLDPGLFKALCDSTRAKLVGCLVKCGQPATVGEIAECCAVDLSVVSRHLQLLARAGILESTKSGRTVTYAVRYEPLCATLRDLADAIEQHHPDGRCAECAGGCGAKR